MTNLPSPTESPFTPTGLVLARGLSFDEWVAIGTTLGTIEHGINWWIGDWLNYGESAYGEKYTQAIQETGRDKQSLADLAWVASKFETSRRRENLAWSHHREVASLPPAEQDRMLDLAERERLSIRGMRENVQLAKKALASGDTKFRDVAISEPSPNGTHPSPNGAHPHTETPLDEAAEEQHAPDPIAEWERAEREKEALRVQVESLSADDKGAELRIWMEKYARLEGRLQQEITRANQAVKQAQYQGEILSKLRRLLKVDSNSEIAGAVQDLIR